MIIKDLDYIESSTLKELSSLILAGASAHTRAHAHVGKRNAYASFDAAARGDKLAIKGKTKTDFRDIGYASYGHAYSTVYAISISKDYEIDVSVAAAVDASVNLHD